MQTALDDFLSNMSRVRALHFLHSSLSKQLTEAVDLSDILRAEVVMAVSAFDFFIHEITRLGMLESLTGKRPRTNAFDKWQLPIEVVTSMMHSGHGEQRLDAEIRTQHGFLSFQQPDAIADAVRLFSSVKLWEEVGKEFGETAEIAKQSFKLIIDRRNKIAHEADIDPSYPGQRWPIDVAEVEKVLDRIEKVAGAIFRVSV